MADKKYFTLEKVDLSENIGLVNIFGFILLQNIDTSGKMWHFGEIIPKLNVG